MHTRPSLVGKFITIKLLLDSVCVYPISAWKGGGAIVGLKHEPQTVCSFKFQYFPHKTFGTCGGSTCLLSREL